MRIAFGSAFRNSAGQQISRYMSQVESCMGKGHDIRVIAAEGDSVDTTREQLARESRLRGIPLNLLDTSHGGPLFGSTEATERMIALSAVGNAIFDAVGDEDDLLVYVESDLLWSAETVFSLVEQALLPTKDVVAPLIFAGDLFYDIWAFRKDGQRFSPFPPHHAEFEHGPVMEVDSAGSCLVMRAEVARQCRIRNGGALVDWCADARSKGYRIWADSRFLVRHPA